MWTRTDREPDRRKEGRSVKRVKRKRGGDKKEKRKRGSLDGARLGVCERGTAAACGKESN